MRDGVTAAFAELGRVVNGHPRDQTVDLAFLERLDAERLQDPRTSVAADRALYQIVHAAKNRVRWNWEAMEELSAMAAGHAPDSPLRMFFGYAYATRAVQRAVGAAGLQRAGLREYREAAGALEAELASAAAQYPAAAVHTIHLGKVASLSDRGRAHELFARARGEAPVFVERLNLDRGAETYLPALDTVPSAYPGEAAQQRVRDALSPSRDARVTLLVSLDERFLRGFGPYWIHLSAYLAVNGVRLVFLVAGPLEATSAAIGEARALSAQTALFHGFRYADGLGIDFVPVAVPDGVADPRSFFAAARLLFAEAVMDAVGTPVVSVDADMTMVRPVDSLIAGLPGADFGCPVTRGSRLLSPWRRYMAGFVTFGDTAAARELLGHVRGYIGRGIGSHRSWTIDQNALAYAAELVESRRVPAHFEDLAHVKRPFVPDATARMVEAPLGSLGRGHRADA